MNNRKWVTLHILWRTVSSHIFLWPTASEWYYTICEGSLITAFPLTGSEWHCTFCESKSHPMINSEWGTLDILWQAVSSHLFLWPTAGGWHCTFCEMQSNHIFSYDQQLVRDIAQFVKGNLITSFPMTNRQWALMLHIFLEGSLIKSFPMTNRKWVTLHILWKAVSSHLFLYQQWVSDMGCFWNAVSSHLFLWHWTVGGWHCTFCEMQSNHIFSYDQQLVRDIAHFVKDNLITSFPVTNRQWALVLHIFFERQSHHIFSYNQ